MVLKDGGLHEREEKKHYSFYLAHFDRFYHERSLSITNQSSRG
jgi:hypothetical protein